MVKGIESFRKWFEGCEEQYAIIGGTACDLLMPEQSIEFRVTKDIDLVLIVEALDKEFGEKLWEYVKEAGYEHRNRSTGKSQFYRFTKPKSNEFPMMIELFTRKLDSIELPKEAVLTPLPVDEDLSSLSAILLDDEYYDFLKNGRTTVNDVTVLDASHLIPFKAKAYLDLTNRKSNGEHVDEKNIRKHKNDIFRLYQLVDSSIKVETSKGIYKDINTFIDIMKDIDIDLKQLGLDSLTKQQILDELHDLYILK